MTKPWISDARQRASKAYAAIHADLREYAIYKAIAATDTRQARHKASANQFKQQGELPDGLGTPQEIR